MQVITKNKNAVKQYTWSYKHTPQVKPHTYQSIVDVFRSNVEKSPHREILIHREPDGFRNALTYLQLQEKSEHLAKYLISKGIQQGDVIGMFGPNSCEWMIGELSILMAGGKAVYLNAGITSAADNVEIMKLTNCKALIVEPGRNEEFLPATENLILNMDSFWIQMGIIVYLQDNNDNLDICLNNILSKTLNEDLSKVKIYPEDTAYIYSTSGSTGKPKLVEISHFVVVNLPDTFMRNKDEDSAKIYCDRPFGWSGGSPIQFLLKKLAHVFCGSHLAVNEVNTKAIWDIIETEKCTQARLLPFHLYDLINLTTHLKHRKNDYRLRNICVIGQIVRDDIMQVVGIFTDSVMIAYGSTEMYAMSVTKNYTLGESFETGSAGIANSGYEIKVVDGNEETVPLGEVGEVYVRSCLAFSGYLKNKEKTKATVRKGGWIKTGDSGFMVENGTLILKGRKTEIISRGTRKIFPNSIEVVVENMKGIEMAIAVGVPDDRLLEEICLCYTANTGFDIAPDDVNEYCQKHFFRGQATNDGLGLMPKYFIQLLNIPRLPNGKPNRSQIKTEAAKLLLQ